MSRRKRASMREGPLADLFRSTSDDAPADPPEAPRYGRQDPAEAKKAEAEQEALPVEEPGGRRARRAARARGGARARAGTSPRREPGARRARRRPSG